MTIPTNDVDLRVEIENTATPEEVRAVQFTLDEFRIPATATATLEPEPRGGISEIPLLIEIATVYSLVKFADAFLAEVGQTAGKSAAEALVNLMGRLRSRRHRPGGYEVVMIDLRSNVRVHLRDDLSAEALSALASMDLDALPPGELWFDRDAGKWIFIPGSFD
jgi:hypothetical protein